MLERVYNWLLTHAHHSRPQRLFVDIGSIYYSVERTSYDFLRHLCTVDPAGLRWLVDAQDMEVDEARRGRLWMSGSSMRL